VKAGKTYVKFWSYSGHIVDIAILDQFGKLLDRVYDGDNVVEEQFTNHRGELPTLPYCEQFSDVMTSKRVPIRIPDTRLANGHKRDEVMAHVAWQRRFDAVMPHTVLMLLLSEWQRGAYMVGPGDTDDNAIAGHLKKTASVTADQDLWVWGHKLMTQYERTMKFNDVQRANEILTVTDRQK
jgi:hypothetical protein